MWPSGSVPRVDARVSTHELNARIRSNQQKLLVTLAATCFCAALIALLGDDSQYQELSVARQQQLDDSTDSTTGISIGN